MSTCNFSQLHTAAEDVHCYPWRELQARCGNTLASSPMTERSCIPATSVPSERAFSIAGHIVNEKRACLLPETVNMMVFLGEILSRTADMWLIWCCLTRFGHYFNFIYTNTKCSKFIVILSLLWFFVYISIMIWYTNIAPLYSKYSRQAESPACTKNWKHELNQGPVLYF